jgi:hypothetical protein
MLQTCDIKEADQIVVMDIVKKTSRTTHKTKNPYKTRFYQPPQPTMVSEAALKIPNQFP